MNNPYYYIGPNPTVDLVIVNHCYQILLIKRSEYAAACPNMWALPGGFVDTDAKKGHAWSEGNETVEMAAIREVKEETNLTLENPHLVYLGIFEGNGRDPRDNQESWSRSYAFLHEIPKEVYEAQKDLIVGLDDASEAKWFPIENLDKLNLAFDHSKIVQKAINKLNQPLKLKIS